MTPWLAGPWLVATLGLAAWCFRGLVRQYRAIAGFPWLHALGFAAAATAALFALRACLAF
jgi:hypothetical protein